MYDDHDRPDPKRMLITVGVTVGGVIAAVAVAGWLIVSLIAPPAPVVSTDAMPEPPVAVATPTAPVTESVAQAEPVVKPKPTPAPAPKPAPKKEEPKPSTTAASGVVVIDPGHQGQANLGLEPIGPGASEKKPKVAGGATGVSTGQPESQVNLEVSLKLRDKLEARGVKVIMVRTSQNVNIPNSERAEIANNAHAALFIRIHCDGVDNHSIHGISTLVPGKNQWTGPIVSPSATAGRLVHKAVIASTGAEDHGVVPRTDMSGFNWAKVPSVIVEMGFLSNSTEDKKLGTSDYQNKLAEGLANGVVDYLNK